MNLVPGDINANVQKAEKLGREAIRKGGLDHNSGSNPAERGI
jgi:hypothetical protein